MQITKFRVINLLNKGNYIPAADIKNEITNILIEKANLFNIVNEILKEHELLKRRKELIKLLIDDLLKISYISCRNNNGWKYVLSDEMLSHRALTIFLKMSFTKDISKDFQLFFEMVGFPKLLINIDCTPELAYQRAIHREKGIPNNLRSLTKKEYIEFLENMNIAKYKICNLMEKNGVQVINIQSEKSLESNIMDLIKKCIL